MKQFKLPKLASLRSSVWLSAIEAAAAICIIGIELTWSSSAAWMPPAVRVANAIVMFAFALRVLVNLLTVEHEWRQPRVVISAVAALVLGLFSLRLTALVALLHDGVLLWRWLRRERSTNRVLVDIGNRPARSLVISFATLIAIGTFLLCLPAAASQTSVRFIDALFTAVSATCVTGLTTVDTASTWSLFGLCVLLALIQLGGLGIMTISAFMSMALGQELGLQQDAVLRGALNEPDAHKMRGMVRSVIGWTLAIEAVGAVVLTARFAQQMPLPKALASALFHSVSAFCNAGFSLYSNNLVPFANDPVVNITIMLLVLTGGAGFGVLVAFGRYARAPKTSRIPVHAKVVLATSVFLVLFGAISFFFFEYSRSLAHLEMGSKLSASFFHSIIARTAGFNTVPLSAEVIHPVSILILSALMFVGASPGSTGGGIKTTTAAIMFLAARAVMLEREAVEVFGRRLPSALVLRALALTGGASLTLAVGLGALLITEEAGFASILFEATSALSTVGLSLGLTPALTDSGRILICILMFLGRIGPLTALAATALYRGAPVRLTLPEGRVLVG